MDPRLRATGAGQESSSSLIPQERKLRDILLSVPPKRGKGTSPLFLRPTFRPRRALPWILLSVTLSCSFDRRVDTRFLQTYPPISPSTNYLMINVRCYGTKFGTFFLFDFSYISFKSKERASVFGLIRAIYLKKCLAQFRNRSKIELSVRDTLDYI